LSAGPIRERAAKALGKCGSFINQAGSNRFGAGVAGEPTATVSGPANLQICFCGPAGLLEEVRKVMAAHGVPKDNLSHELFDFR
jgi:hypothetical protein